MSHPTAAQSHPTTDLVSPNYWFSLTSPQLSLTSPLFTFTPPQLVWTCLFPQVKLTPISADQHSTLYTMVSNPSPQCEDLFQACHGFARQLSKSHAVYCRLEVKLVDKSFNFRTGSPGKFPGKGKVQATTGKTREEGNLLKRGIPTPVNQKLVLLLLEQRTKWYFPQLYLLLLAIELYPGQNIYSLRQIYHSWTELEVLTLKRTRYPSISYDYCVPGEGSM